MANIKSYLDNYFNTRTKDLEKYFKKFALDKEKDKFPEMLSLLYLHTFNNLSKIKPIIEKNQYHYYAIKFIYNQRNWTVTDFKKEISDIKNNSEIFDTYDVEDDEQDIELQYKKQMDYDRKLAKLKLGVDNLDYYEKILYDKYFVQGLSLRKIGSQVGLSHAAIFTMVNRIKTKIINTPI